MEEIKVSEMLQADSISKNDSVMIIQGGVNKQAKGDTAEATGTSLSLSSVADTCKVKSNSKNLIDESKYRVGYLVDANGDLVANSVWSTSDKIYVTSEITISASRINGATNNSQLNITQFSSADALIKRDTYSFTNDTYSLTFTPESGVAYIRVGYRHETTENVQLELGSTATSYNPYNTEVFIAEGDVSSPTIEAGTIQQSNGQNASGSRMRSAGYISVEPNSVYTLDAEGNTCVIFEYKSDNTYIHRIPDIWIATPYTFTTTSETAKVRFVTESPSVTQSQIKFQEGSKNQEITLTPAEEKIIFSYDTKTGILANGSVTATYNKEPRLLNNDDTTAIKEYVDDIIEEGTNANGTYIKYRNGTMICTSRTTLTNIVVGTASGSCYSNDANINIDFPKAFISRPIVSLQVTGTTTGWLMTYTATGTPEIKTDGFRIFRTTSRTASTYYIDMIAIGRWR